MESTGTFLVALLIQFIGHCNSMGDHLTVSKALTSFQRVVSITDFPEIEVENVQLIEYIDGEIIELEQQDFDTVMMSNVLREADAQVKLFRDNLFPVKLFPLRPDQLAKRAKNLVENPVLFDVNAKHFHVKQGSLGDCWFLVGLINLQFYENLFKFIVPYEDQSFEDDIYAGIFHFRFWQSGTWVDVVVDDRLPIKRGKLAYASSGNVNEFWIPLIEKAHAKLLYRSYDKLDAGYEGIAMQDLSGGISESFVVAKSVDYLFESMQNTFRKSSMIACGTYSEDQMTANVGVNTFDINPDHAYAITDLKIMRKDDVDGEIKLLRISNPHGCPSSNRYPGKIREIFSQETVESELQIEVDGQSWILYDDFIKFFETVDICHLTPNRLTGDIYSVKGGNKLSLSSIEGKWMGGISSKEVILDNFLKVCPQYRMILKESNEGDECDVLIGLSLKSRHDTVGVDDFRINFEVLKYEDHEEESLPKPLLDYTKKCIHISPDGSCGVESGRYDLKPGTYYIVPFINDAFKTATFLLRALSEQRDILEVYDRDVDMPDVKEKIQTLKSDFIEEADQQLFSDMESLNVPMNFKSLHNILKNNTFSLNKNCDTMHDLDDEIDFEFETLLQTKKFVPKKKLSVAKIAEIILNIEEAFELYQQPDHTGFVHVFFINSILKQNGYSMNNNLLKTVVSNSIERNNLIQFNDLSLIVFTLKSQFGSYCEELSANLCRDLIDMVNSEMYSTNGLRIGIQQYKMIIQFIKELKTIFYDNASPSYRSLSFTKLRDALDSFDYKLTYDIVATIFHSHGNDVDIFFHQFVQAVVDVTLISEKIQMMSLDKGSANFNEFYHNMFHQAWKKIQRL